MKEETKKSAPKNGTRRRQTPARTPEARENQLIGLAMELVEQQLRDGSVTSQVLTHFLRLATVKEKLQNEKLRSDLKVAEAKIKQIESQEDIKEMYSQALAAMKSYSGAAFEEEIDDY